MKKRSPTFKQLLLHKTAARPTAMTGGELRREVGPALFLVQAGSHAVNGDPPGAAVCCVQVFKGSFPLLLYQELDLVMNFANTHFVHGFLNVCMIQLVSHCFSTCLHATFLSFLSFGCG